MSSILSEPNSLQNVRALITSKWSDRGYTQRIVSNIESFYVDSSLDNDADSWQLVLGDPYGDFLALLERNSEVRVELVSATRGAAGHIFSGIADDVSFTEEGALTIVGRDYSSLALDSTCPPCRFKAVKAWYPITKQATEVGFTNISLARVGEIKKTIKTDGSESYWEFWYRLYRQEKMWLWCGPNGALIGQRLNYGQSPVYYFGTPKQTDTDAIKGKYISVEHVEIRKSTQGRLGTVNVQYKDGKTTRIVKTGLTDPTLNGWMKRPFKIIQAVHAHNDIAARKEGWEEIFEGKVGSLEIRLTISDPGQIIRTNQVALVRLPEINYGGDFFIIGWRMQADSDGFIQEIRLRERDIALSRRIPEQPKIPPRRTIPNVDNSVPGRDKVSTQATNDVLATLVPGDHGDWGDFFYKAAHQWAGDWDQGLFLACILGIAWHETKIQNIRQFTGHHDHQEWFPFKAEPIGSENPAPSTTWGDPGNLIPKGTHDVPIPGKSLDDYHEAFVNNYSDARAMIGTTFYIGVGPMQLTDVGDQPGIKEAADDYFSQRTGKPTNHDQYTGGRWDPESNIWIGAKRFKQALDSMQHASTSGDGLTPDSGDQKAAMWRAFAWYAGAEYNARGETLAKELRYIVMVNPGFLKTVDSVIPQLRKIQQNSSDNSTSGTSVDEILGPGWPSVDDCRRAFTEGAWVGSKASAADPSPKAPLPNIPYLAAKYQHDRVATASIKYIVIHVMQMPLTDQAAENCANYFTDNKDPGSAHYCIDNDSIVQSVHDADFAYGVMGSQGLFSYNDISLHFEHAGWADTRDGHVENDWSSDYCQKMLRLSAQLTAARAKKYGVPMVYQNKAGLDAGQSGFTGHSDVVASSGSGDHTDPGPAFPWASYMQMVRDAADA